MGQVVTLTAGLLSWHVYEWGPGGHTGCVGTGYAAPLPRQECFC